MMREIPSFPHYYASEDGRIYAGHRECSGRRKYSGGYFLTLQTDNRGYTCASLYNGKRLVHRLIAEAYLANPEKKPCVIHLNGDKSDNRAFNLAWATQKEVADHNKRLGIFNNSGANNPAAVLTEQEVEQIRKDDRPSYTLIAADYRVHSCTIGRIVRRESWK